jgi:dephospho-CoA kinase
VSRIPNKYIIGLTGNIAVGKSVVRQMAQHLGAYPIDADALAHQAMAPGAPAYKPVVETFGQFILGEDQRINRQILGQIVFSNPAALAKLEAITHPIIRQAILALASRAKQRIIIIEAIKLLEGELAQVVDEVWVVDAKPEVQYRRLLEKRKMSSDEAKRRILAQTAQSEKLKKANVVINNNGNVEETWKQVQSAWNTIISKLDALQAAPTVATRPTGAAQQAIAAAADAVESSVSGVHIKRGMPNNAETIAQFISSMSGQPTSRMDVMMSFGQKSYLLAYDDQERMIGLMGWQVENLITRVDEFYLLPSIQKEPVIQALLNAVEIASKELQSEVGFIFLPQTSARDTLSAIGGQGYEPTTISEIKIPAWREALHEMSNGSPSMMIMHKPLRKDRVLKPI